MGKGMPEQVLSLAKTTATISASNQSGRRQFQFYHFFRPPEQGERKCWYYPATLISSGRVLKILRTCETRRSPPNVTV
jgi:hypothetical protein